ncbi:MULTISPECIES: DNA circularization N-terminal domain-containing protein [unclassified Rhizobium]|uniref:DNA circularization N-terminal domain-containing protein n=1 Tax=unclassified Rhizobium TaxID=2613769 RepID=UPI0017807262|nr:MULTISPECIES: DNA circularization N-terminal domain-containing protein [unclassified Rhizobium]MBD8686569.1 DNA circularization N-terminal domain-containing protein [Rhizobium sp. CFBP 13644]MBD8691629.1 DNA circularization N-terminal domain-containing protein [Rhizobium sp. CFBP 13717]
MNLDSLDTIPGLLPGMYRGIPLHIADTTTDSGRRVLEYLFPGVDAAAYDDFGVLPSVVSIDALVISDDYKLRATALQAAFEAAGPGLLLHPWLGPMSVMMDEPAQISFSSKELRLVRISARFKRVLAASSLLSAVASGLGTAVSSMVSAASALALAVGLRIITATRTASVTRSARIVSAAASAITPPAGSARVMPQILKALSKAPATSTGYDLWIAGAAALIEAATDVPAVAPAASAPVETRPSVQSVMEIGLSFARRLSDAAIVAPSDSDRALLLSAAAQFLAAAAAQSSYGDYASRREAQNFRSRMTLAITALVEELETFGSALFQAEASALIRASRNLHASVIADINEVIGRLPDVLTFKPTNDISAWQLALHVAGDTPSRIEDVYRDIVARNDPSHPASMEPGAIEVLDIRR